MLTDRQKLILAALVEDYVRSAEPVGSRTLSKHSLISFSPATIRNEMADLEEMGYLDQPHTSAGRIPSQKGYRFYVDHLVTSKTPIESQTLESLRDLFQQKMNEVERMIQQTSVVLSELTQYTSIVLGPTLKQGRVKQLELVPLGNRQAVAILVTDTGAVYNRQVELSPDVSSEEIASMVRFLNAKLTDVPLTHLRSKLHRVISNELADALEHFEDALAILDGLTMTNFSEADKIYVNGATNILAQPEFQDLDKVRPLLAMLESSAIGQIVLAGGEGLSVRIGQENNVPTLRDCTIISATYTVNNVPVGRIGVLGPTRMNYARVIQILEYTSRALTQTLNNRMHSP